MSTTASPPPAHGTIRFEDLGEPVQRLIKSLKGDVTEEDYALLEYVSVKDMAKIYSEMGTDRQVEDIWEELRASLQERRANAARREADMAARQRELDEERLVEERRLREQEEEEERERLAEELDRKRRAEERARRAAMEEKKAAAEEEEAAAAARAAEEAAEEAAREEERRKKAERKRKRREARARELQEEQEALEAEKARFLAKRNRNQKKDWDDYVENHPLQFAGKSGNGEEIEQKQLSHTLNAPPKISDELLQRTYTAKCPECSSRFPQPPSLWVCPLCERRAHKRVMVWQPDSDSKVCMCCKTSISRWTRHHCRNCGRLVCSNCCGNRAIIEALGFVTPVKVCDQCATNRPAAQGW